MSFLSFSQKALVDRLARVVDDVEVRMMFGTVGLFADNQQFGLLEEDRLYLSVDDDHRDTFAEAETEPYSASTIEEAAYAGARRGYRKRRHARRVGRAVR
jgi:TfoX/Sxy family transcriptional regulator of competence genes